MNAIVQQILSEMSDTVLPKIKEHHDAIAKLASNWLKAKEELLPVFKAFEVLGADISADATAHICVRIAGDKDCFVRCWKLWRSVGVRLSPPEKGATQVAEFIHPFDVRVFFYFTSTVCKRVKVGTKMVEQDIYETHCGTDLATIDQKELEGPSGGELVPVEDAIPF